jgi:hypothetical protein
MQNKAHSLQVLRVNYAGNTNNDLKEGISSCAKSGLDSVLVLTQCRLNSASRMKISCSPKR